eukprot:3372117-Amphidinium_carterae.1
MQTLLKSVAERGPFLQAEGRCGDQALAAMPSKTRHVSRQRCSSYCRDDFGSRLLLAACIEWAVAAFVARS